VDFIEWCRKEIFLLLAFPNVTSQTITIGLPVNVKYEVSCTHPTSLVLQSLLAKPYLMADVTNTLGFASARRPIRVSLTTFNANLGALCGPIFIRTLPVSVHRIVLNSFKRSLNLEPLHSRQYLEVKPQCH